MSLRRLKQAVRYWELLEQTYLGVLPSSSMSFTPAILTETLNNMKNNKDSKAARKDEAADVQKRTLVAAHRLVGQVDDVVLGAFHDVLQSSQGCCQPTPWEQEHGDVMPEIWAAT
jgi:hypothetical protein